MGLLARLTFWILISCYKHQDVMSQQNSFQFTCLQHIVNRFIKDANWTSVSMIHSSIEMDDVPQSVKQQRYNIDSTDIYTALQSIHSLSFPDINIIIAVNDTWTQRIVEAIDKYDFFSNGITDYRHHSKILLVMWNITELPVIEQVIQHLENVAVRIVDKDNCNTSGDRLRTLHIHPIGRVFAPLSNMATSSLPNRIFPNVKYGYNNRRVLVTTVESIPRTIKEVQNGKVLYSGYNFDIWKAIAKRLNISYDVTEPEDLDWGIKINGQWNGMVRQLVEKEVDLAVADLTVSYERAQDIDFVFPAVMVDEVDIMYRRQPSSDNTFFLLLRPLHKDVYIVFLSICVGIVMMYFIFEHHLFFNTRLSQFAEPCHTLSNIILEFIATILKQEFKVNPTTYAGKVLLSSWCLLVLLITSIYCGNLIAALSTQTGFSKLSSINELVDSDFTTGVLNVGMTYKTITTSDRPELKRLYAKMVQTSKNDGGIFSNDRLAHVARVKNEKHAYICYTSAAERHMAEDCNLALIGEPVTWAGEYVTFAVPKGSPLKSDIDKTMAYLKESGVVDMILKKWLTGNNSTTCTVDRQITAITLREVTGGFLVVCGGLGLSLLTLLLEMGYRYIGT